MNKPQYMKCPRCELNYILKKDKFCDVCKSEMKAGSLTGSDLDDEFEGMEELLCPICKTNYITDGETMCATCLEENQISDTKDDDPNWRSFVDKDEDSDDMDLLPIEDDDDVDSSIAKELADEYGDDELDRDDDYSGDDDLDFAPASSSIDYDDDDDDEEEPLSDDDDEDDDERY